MNIIKINGTKIIYYIIYYYIIRPADAEKKVELLLKKRAAQKNLQQEILAKKCILEVIDTSFKVIDITISYVSNTNKV